VVRTRTTILQAHTHQWMGTFGGAGNGDYRGDLKRATSVIATYATTLTLVPSQILVRLDGLYGNAAPLTDVLTAGLGVIARSKDYTLLDLAVVQKRLAYPPEQECTHPESGTTRTLYDCPEVPLTPGGPRMRLVVATHPATSSLPTVGVQREGMVYELFVSTLPCPAFTAKDVLDLYLHRGSFETFLADEDSEQDPDRWCSHAGGETGMLADPEPMDVESSSGTRTAPLSHSHANDRIRSSARSLAGSLCRADGRGTASFHSGVWPCAMGTPFV
jgi:hypothetical protein